MMKSVSDNDEKCLRSPLLLSSRNPQTMSACTLCNALLIMSLLAASPLAASWRRRRSMSAHDVSLQRPAHHVMLGFPLGRRCTRRNCLPSNDVCMHTTSLSATPCSSCHCCGLPMSLRPSHVALQNRRKDQRRRRLSHLVCSRLRRNDLPPL